jgi:hypothetical protein
MGMGGLRFVDLWGYRQKMRYWVIEKRDVRGVRRRWQKKNPPFGGRVGKNTEHISRERSGEVKSSRGG